MSQAIYHGQCLCGGIAFTLQQEFTDIIQCHCQNCRKASGTAFATNALIARTAFELVQGNELLNSFSSSVNAKRYFCSRCGSPIFSVKATDPDVYRIRLGLIEEPIQQPISKHVFVGSKANWEQINDDIPQFFAFPELITKR